MLGTRAGTGVQEGTHIFFMYFSSVFLSHGQGTEGRGWDSGAGHTKGGFEGFFNPQTGAQQWVSPHLGLKDTL